MLWLYCSTTIRIIPCNYILSVWYPEKEQNCKYCKSAKDTIAHFFFDCQWWKQLSDFNFPLNTQNIIFGFENYNNDTTIDVLNYCVMICKWYIYTQKVKDLDIFHWIYPSSSFKGRNYRTQYIMKDQQNEFCKKWGELCNNL